MCPMSPRLLRPRATGFHPEAQDWRNRVIANGGTVSGSTLKAVSDFCRSIDAAGIRDRFLRLNLFCGNSSSTLAAVRTPLYRGQSLTGTQLGNTTDTNVNFVQGDYTETGAGGGLNSNGTTKYLNTGVAANATTLGDRHLAIYEVSKTPNAFDISIGARSSSPVTYFELTTTSPATNYVFRSSDSVTSAADSGYSAAGAMMMGVHPSSHTGVLYRNGSSTGTANFASRNNTYGGSIFVFTANSDGSPTDYADITSGGYSIGLAMTAAQALAYYNAMQAFQTALGRQV